MLGIAWAEDGVVIFPVLADFSGLFEALELCQEAVLASEPSKSSGI